MLVQVAQGTLLLAMEKGRFTSDEARTLKDEIEQRARHHEMTEMATSSIMDFEMRFLPKMDSGSQSWPSVSMR